MRIVSLIMAALAGTSCIFETGSRRAGSAAQGGNAIVVGRILAMGFDPAGAEVVIRKFDYLPYPEGTLPGSPEGARTTADGNGRFRLPGLRSGTYSLMIGKQTRGLKVNVVVPADSGTVNIPEDSLVPTGMVSGIVSSPDDSPRPAYVQIYGSDRIAPTDPGTGAFEIKGLPAGTYRLRGFTDIPNLSGEADLSLEPGQSIDSMSLPLQPSRAMTFGNRVQGFMIQGVDADNPIIYDNNNFAASMDDEYLWIKTSEGATLAGVIATREIWIPVQSDTGYHSNFDSIYADAVGSVETARRSGMKGIPDPVRGAALRLAAKPGGSAGEFTAEDNAGSRLIIAEAKKASPEKPLLIIVEGEPVTEANALLLDSTIADNIIVFGYEFGRAVLSWETFLIAKKCRYVNCNLRWGADFPLTPPSDLMRNPLGDSLRANWMKVRPGSTSRWGSVSAVLYLFNPSTWRQAVPMVLPAADKFAPGTVTEMEFLHVPEEAVDKRSQVLEFLKTVSGKR